MTGVQTCALPICAFFSLAFSAYTSTIVLLMKDYLKLGPAKVGTLFLLFGTYLIFNQSIVAPKLAKRIGNLNTFYLGQVFFVIGLIGLTFVQSVFHLALAVYFTNLGFSTVFPTFKSLITDVVSKTKQGEITGIDESVMAGASAIAPILASVIYQWTGQLSYAIFIIFILFPHLFILFKTGKLKLSEK